MGRRWKRFLVDAIITAEVLQFIFKESAHLINYLAGSWTTEACEHWVLKFADTKFFYNIKNARKILPETSKPSDVKRFNVLKYCAEGRFRFSAAIFARFIRTTWSTTCVMVGASDVSLLKLFTWSTTWLSDATGVNNRQNLNFCKLLCIVCLSIWFIYLHSFPRINSYNLFTKLKYDAGAILYNRYMSIPVLLVYC